MLITFPKINKYRKKPTHRHGQCFITFRFDKSKFSIIFNLTRYKNIVLLSEHLHIKGLSGVSLILNEIDARDLVRVLMTIILLQTNFKIVKTK